VTVREGSTVEEVRRIRSDLDHPIIDADGHAIEYLPLVRAIAEEVAGASVAEGLDRVLGASAAIRHLPAAEKRALGAVRGPWWGLPAANTLDRGTAMLPALLAERIEEVGIDHAVLYPTYGLMVSGLDDAEVRVGLARAFNTFYAEAFGPHRARLTPVGIIPMHSPDEAIAELDYATATLGLRAFMFGGPIARPIPGSSLPVRAANWIDSLGVDSEFDYDPVWQRCVELGVAPTFHTSAMGWSTHSSPTSYVSNHLGMFATAGELMCRTLLLSGVTARFPSLRFAFQEGGVGWAATLLSDLIGHWEKRNGEAVSHYDPSKVDLDELRGLFARYGSTRMAALADQLPGALRFLSDAEDHPSELDEFAAAQIKSSADIAELFSNRFFFGCEADDPMTALAFAGGLPHDARLPALFASDIGHWDVPDIRGVLIEAWELVEEGRASAADFRDLTFANAVALWAGSNPSFFEGTTVAAAVAAEMGGAEGA
jgi:predicted TIM-barrel fold metal-dependent hydrolase